jgi:hypothetical protein
MKIDCVVASEHVDSSGEIIKMDGCDISEIEAGKGYVNWEHSNEAEAIIGKILYGKKIYSEKDCDDQRQLMFWNKTKVPFLYGIIEFFDEEDSAPAAAIQAMIRYFARRKIPIKLGVSVEGATIQRDGNVLTRTIARGLACTLKPCNHSAILDLIEDSQITDYVHKSEASTAKTWFEFEDNNFIIEDLVKTVTASPGNTAPGQLTGQAALTPERISHQTRNKLKAVVRDWPRSRPLKEFIKAQMPEVTDKYIDHFVDAAEQIALSKGEPVFRRIGVHHSKNKHMDQYQKNLINGVYTGRPSEMNDPEFEKYRIQRVSNDLGDSVLLKKPDRFGKPHGHHEISGLTDAEAASHYYHLARDFFGMRDHVPTTTHFHDHDGHGPNQAQQYLKGSMPAVMPEVRQHLINSIHDGTAHKLALMDLITGTKDRHGLNAMIDPSNGRMSHIDNDLAFANLGKKSYENHFADSGTLPHPPRTGPGYLSAEDMPDHVVQWATSLSPRKLAYQMKKYGMNDIITTHAVKNLRHVQKKLAQGVRRYDEINKDKP